MEGLVSEDFISELFPKYIWIVDSDGQAFEAIHGGTHTGHYHGYPVRRTEPFFEKLLDRGLVGRRGR